MRIRIKYTDVYTHVIQKAGNQSTQYTEKLDNFVQVALSLYRQTAEYLQQGSMIELRQLLALRFEKCLGL